MHVLLLGVSHRTAPVGLRERLDFSSRGVREAVSHLAALPEYGEAAVLSTCNRSELYVAADNVADARLALRRFFAQYHALALDQLEPHFYEAVDADAARHLFRVAAGLDSLVIGEPQILGQVKDAYHAANELHSVGAVLTKLFHWSFNVGKRVRTETALAEGAVSVSYAAVALARKIFGDLSGRSVLVIGAGEMGKLTATHLKAQGIHRLTITSRTAAHAQAVADAIGGDSAPWELLPAALAAADIVITATGSELPILTRAQVESTMRARRHQPLFLIDIAVPRDIEPSAGEINQVFLYNIDDLQSIVQENLSRRGGEVTRAEAIVSQEVERFHGWMRARGVIPTVVALRERFERIRQSELRRLEPKMSGLPPEARARIDEITRLIVEKLLLTPTEQLKAIGDPETVVVYSDALSRLFSLTNDETMDEERAAAAAASAAPDQRVAARPKKRMRV
jgi:glutamyl-tRNA reductase